MILVDVSVPAVEGTFDFFLSEHTPIQELLEDMIGLLEQKLAGRTAAKAGDFCLCSRELACVLPPQATLWECGIRQGSNLLLV